MLLNFENYLIQVSLRHIYLYVKLCAAKGKKIFGAGIFVLNFGSLIFKDNSLASVKKAKVSQWPHTFRACAVSSLLIESHAVSPFWCARSLVNLGACSCGGGPGRRGGSNLRDGGD